MTGALHESYVANTVMYNKVMVSNHINKVLNCTIADKLIT